jgi:hypothetical protein
VTRHTEDLRDECWQPLQRADYKIAEERTSPSWFPHKNLSNTLRREALRFLAQSLRNHDPLGTWVETECWLLRKAKTLHSVCTWVTKLCEPRKASQLFWEPSFSTVNQGQSLLETVVIILSWKAKHFNKTIWKQYKMRLLFMSQVLRKYRLLQRHLLETLLINTFQLDERLVSERWGTYLGF